MTDAPVIEGKCLCGAVKVRVPAPTPKLRACHCEMCRKLTSGIYFSIMTEQDGMTVDGPVKTYRSSDWAERGFCDTCGSVLWYSTVHDGARYLSAGLFENAGGGDLVIEFYEDHCPDGYALMGEHKKLTREETIALFAGEEG